MARGGFHILSTHPLQKPLSAPDQPLHLWNNHFVCVTALEHVTKPFFLFIPLTMWEHVVTKFKPGWIHRYSAYPVNPGGELRTRERERGPTQCFLKCSDTVCSEAACYFRSISKKQSKREDCFASCAPPICDASLSSSSSPSVHCLFFLQLQHKLRNWIFTAPQSNKVKSQSDK